MSTWKVYYHRPVCAVDAMRGYDAFKARWGSVDFTETHALVKEFTTGELTKHCGGASHPRDCIYRLMQAEYWSPNGEARELIEKLGLSHTSMCVGDAILTSSPNMGDHLWFCDLTGWREIIPKVGQ